mmetsp:Transcript_37570/g.88425  ORF Transcript_37570/g.88425 Transcript_37570/m.88425 type:complete len:280 (+) Transcript_37570:2487-3326(+)
MANQGPHADPLRYWGEVRVAGARSRHALQAALVKLSLPDLDGHVQAATAQTLSNSVTRQRGLVCHCKTRHVRSVPHEDLRLRHFLEIPDDDVAVQRSREQDVFVASSQADNRLCMTVKRVRLHKVKKQRIELKDLDGRVVAAHEHATVIHAQRAAQRRCSPRDTVAGPDLFTQRGPHDLDVAVGRLALGHVPAALRFADRFQFVLFSLGVGSRVHLLLLLLVLFSLGRVQRFLQVLQRLFCLLDRLLRQTLVETRRVHAFVSQDNLLERCLVHRDARLQ